MKILLVVDGTLHSEMAIRMVRALSLPTRTELIVMTVVAERNFFGGAILRKLKGTAISNEPQQQKALELLRNLNRTLSSRKFKVESVVRWGNPADEIIKVSTELGVSLVIMGARGFTDPLTFHLGGVAQTVMKQARCSVLLARKKVESADQTIRSGREKATVNRVLLATDGSENSAAVAQFLLDLPLPQQTEVIMMTAFQSNLAAPAKTTAPDLQIDQELLDNLQAEESEARKITTEVEWQFQEKGYKTASVVMRGGADDAILAGAKQYQPDIIALGSVGRSSLESLLIGTVTEKVARYADCSVLIGRAAK